MVTMNENMTTVLKCFSRVEGNAEKPQKQRRIAEITEHEGSSFSEGEIPDSVTQITGGKDGDAPTSNTSASEDNLLSEIAQDFDNEPCKFAKDAPQGWYYLNTIH